MSDLLSPRLYQALCLAFELHGPDARKSSSVPVLAHLLSVCTIVQHDGGDEDEAVAALLHDCLEDKPTEISEARLRARFGDRVAKMILAATDTPRGWDGTTPKSPTKTRREAYLAHVTVVDASLLRPTIADKIDNVRSIIADYRRLGETLWLRFNVPREAQLWYYRACVDAYKARGVFTALVGELDGLVTTLENAVRANPADTTGSRQRNA